MSAGRCPLYLQHSQELLFKSVERVRQTSVKLNGLENIHRVVHTYLRNLLCNLHFMTLFFFHSRKAGCMKCGPVEIAEQSASLKETI